MPAVVGLHTGSWYCTCCIQDDASCSDQASRPPAQNTQELSAASESPLLQ